MDANNHQNTIWCALISPHTILTPSLHTQPRKLLDNSLIDHLLLIEHSEEKKKLLRWGDSSKFCSNHEADLYLMYCRDCAYMCVHLFTSISERTSTSCKPLHQVHLWGALLGLFKVCNFWNNNKNDFWKSCRFPANCIEMTNSQEVSVLG